MKLTKYSVFFLIFLISCSCFNLSKLKKFKQKVLEVPKDLETYPMAVLSELNEYLSMYNEKKLNWNDQLQITSKTSAEEIMANNTFGHHNSMEKWQAQVPNDIFTEMCFNVNVTNTNHFSKKQPSKTQKIKYDTKMSVGTIRKPSNVPTAQMFAKNILESLESEHLLISLSSYNDCGIYIAAKDQTKFPNEYLVVMHLISDPN